jgi:hypothetical protein
VSFHSQQDNSQEDEIKYQDLSAALFRIKNVTGDFNVEVGYPIVPESERREGSMSKKSKQHVSDLANNLFVPTAFPSSPSLVIIIMRLGIW